MDAVRVEVVRELLAGSEWPELTRSFAGSLRGAVRRGPAGGLLLVGSGGYEPWHMAAHLDDEAAWSGLPELSPTLVRHRVPQGAPPHLAVGTARLEAARRGETVLVVTPERAEAGLLERVEDARRSGATVLAMDAGDPELRGLAHEALTVPPEPSEVGMDVLQHLVSAAAGRRVRLRDRLPRLTRLAEQLVSPPPASW
ncbi:MULTISPECIES: hypothetical protein [unclassified Streptomyces]|uniref:hypothetical protein n=1 Tax=unclassified Streptomyces TaxID=2593676 RepID=UPI00036A1422|nr:MULTISPECIES: hypothetical protein [unclassified Streptomyces]MYX32345.1 hypothetical protein [Streptomyces sp. SID8377]